jgi:hypothetical protein
MSDEHAPPQAALKGEKASPGQNSVALFAGTPRALLHRVGLGGRRNKAPKLLREATLQYEVRTLSSCRPDAFAV